MADDLFSYFRSRFPEDMEKVFLETSDGRIITYGNLLTETGRLANLLMSLGLAPGDRLAVQAEKSADALLLYLATLRAGAVYLPLNPAYTASEVRYFLTDAAPRAFIHDPANESALSALATELGIAHRLTLGPDSSGTLMAAAMKHGSDFTDIARNADDLAAILYTSGTTGRSKGAMLTHANLRSNADVLCSFWRFTAEDVLLHALPIFHTHGLFVGTNVTLAAGASMLFLPRFELGDVIRLLPRASVMMGVPTFYTRLLGAPAFTRDLVAHMRLFVSGSAPLLSQTHTEFTERTGHAILERYGMTETNMNTSNPYDGARIPGSVGPALPGVEVRIANPETGKPIRGDVGVIEVRGPNVFGGYWNMPERTAEEFRADGFFITGDLGHIDERGYVYIIGRAKDLIISGGLNVYPVEVEDAINALPGVTESAVIGVPHPDFGEAVVAVVKLNAGAGMTESQMNSQLAERLAGFKRPKRVLFTDELPRNTMGKVQKKALRDLHARLFS